MRHLTEAGFKTDRPHIHVRFILLALALLASPSLSALAADDPLKIVIAHGPGKGELGRLAEYLEANYNVECRFVVAEKAKREKGAEEFAETNFEGIEALDDCDVILSNLYRTWAPPDQLAKLKQAFRSKPVVGLRKAHHGFQNWLEADREVFGVDYRGHYGSAKNGGIWLLDEYAGHPFFKGMDVTLPGGGCYGHRDPDSDLTVYMVGGEAGKEPHPQVWSRIVKDRDGQRVFYARYDPEDVDTNPTVRRMVIHAIFWAANRDIAAAEKAAAESAETK